MFEKYFSNVASAGENQIVIWHLAIMKARSIHARLCTRRSGVHRFESRSTRRRSRIIRSLDNYRL